MAASVVQLQAQIAELKLENKQLRNQGQLNGKDAANTPPGLEGVEGAAEEQSTDAGRPTRERGGRNRGPRPARQAERPEGDAASTFVGRTFWVGKDTQPNKVSFTIVGATLPSARTGFPVFIMSKYYLNTHTAMKGIVMATRQLASGSAKGEEDVHIGMIPMFRDNRNEITLEVVKMPGPPRHLLDPSIGGAGESLTVAGNTDPKILAGAIAGQIRDGGPVKVRGIGAKAIFEMVRAIAIARAYLETDRAAGKLGLDIVAFPTYVPVQLPGRQETSMAMLIVIDVAPEFTGTAVPPASGVATHAAPAVAAPITEPAPGWE